MKSPLEVCGVKKLVGYASGAALIIIKVILVIIVCQYHIPLGYTPIKSIRLSCIATAVGFGISAFHTSVLILVKSLTIRKFQNFTKPLFLKQYIVSCLCIMFLIRYIQTDNYSFEWFKAIICPVILTLEFMFYRLFVESKQREDVVIEAPMITPSKFNRKQSLKNPLAIEKFMLTK